MIIYNYDEITGEYLSYCEADLDPEETAIQGHDVYLIPDFATTVQPPTYGEHQTVIYNNGWQIVDDFRGLYKVNSYMQPEEINEIGSLPEGYAVATPAQVQKILEDDLYYIVSDGELIVNPDYAEQKQAREAERISHLKCTKRVLILILEQFGFDYFEQIEPLINANRQAKLEWELCVELERANPLLDLMGAQLGILPAQIDNIFRYVNGEITTLEG